jgi:hypothetical protein
MRRTVAALLAVVVLTGRGSAQEPAIGTVLARAAAYVADYRKRLSGIVAEEFYRQNVSSTRSGRASSRQYRELRSDVLLVKPGADESWMQFRDVFEVDRKPVRDRDERLYKLFVNAKPDRREQAETIQAESARYNIGPLLRTINIPIMALLFFDLVNQYGLRFERVHADPGKRFAELAGTDDVWTLEYREVTEDTLVKGPHGLGVPSHGRAWIDSVTGRILRTEHISEDTSVRAVVDVTYKAEPGLDLLVPAEMRENYLIRKSEVRIDGRATYGRFRQFTVTTSEKPKGEGSQVFW